MNRVFLMGRLVKDPQVYETKDSKQKIVKYTLAVDRRGDTKGTDFISCICFGNAADFAERYLTKGRKILVEGKWETGSYNEKNTGKKIFTNTANIYSHYFVDPKPKATMEGPDGEQQVAEFMDIPDGFSEEVPFT